MQGEKRNFTFAQLGYVPSSSFTVNATVDKAAGHGLQLYCAPGAAQALNSSAPLPSLASALGTTSEHLQSLYNVMQRHAIDRFQIGRAPMQRLMNGVKSLTVTQHRAKQCQWHVLFVVRWRGRLNLWVMLSYGEAVMLNLILWRVLRNLLPSHSYHSTA